MRGLCFVRDPTVPSVALGPKIRRSVYPLLKTRAPYRDPGVDDEALVELRNAPGWIQALKKCGY